METVKGFVGIQARSRGLYSRTPGYRRRSSRDPRQMTIFSRTSRRLHSRTGEDPAVQAVIAEPGRFFAEESCTLHVPIIGKRHCRTANNVSQSTSLYTVCSRASCLTGSARVSSVSRASHGQVVNSPRSLDAHVIQRTSRGRCVVAE